MSPVSPSRLARAAVIGIPSLINTSSLADAASGSSNWPQLPDFFPVRSPPKLAPILDFNGTVVWLPPPSGPFAVSVEHLTLEDSAEHRSYFSPLCQNATESHLRNVFGDDGGSYYKEACEGPRHIGISVFYPECLPKHQRTLATVFEDDLAIFIKEHIFGVTKANEKHRPVYSHAQLQGVFCLTNPPLRLNQEQTDTYPLILLNPPLGGQRQSYTQLATEFASTGKVVITLDHSLLSGIVGPFSGIGVPHVTRPSRISYLQNQAGRMIAKREAVNTYIADMMVVLQQLSTTGSVLEELFRSNDAQIDLEAICAYGLGTGATAARLMFGNNMISCGGALEGLRWIPAPYTEDDIFYKPYVNQTNESEEDEEDDGLEDKLKDEGIEVSGDMLDRLKRMAAGLRKTLMDSLSTMLCRVIGTCGTQVQVQVQKRGQPDWDWDYYKKSLSRYPYGHAWDGDYKKSPYYDDYHKCDGCSYEDCGDDRYDECDCDCDHEYDCKYNHDDHYRYGGRDSRYPPKAYPPNRALPNNGDPYTTPNKLVPDTGDWEQDWKNYKNFIGDLPGRPMGKDVPDYSGYKPGYPGFPDSSYSKQRKCCCSVKHGAEEASSHRPDKDPDSYDGGHRRPDGEYRGGHRRRDNIPYYDPTDSEARTAEEEP